MRQCDGEVELCEECAAVFRIKACTEYKIKSEKLDCMAGSRPIFIFISAYVFILQGMTTKYTCEI